MRALGIVTRVLFIATLSGLIFSATVAFLFNSLWLYENGFEKYNVSQTTGLDEAKLEKAAKGLINYLNSDEEYISVTVVKDGQPFELFNQREKIHMKDVKELIQLDYQALLGTAIYVGAYAGICLFWRKKKYWHRLAWGTVIGSSIALGMIIAIGVGSTIEGFEQIFTQFHLFAFSNEFWLLDPSRDYLIMLFPEGFWYDVGVLFGGIVAGVAGTLLGVAGGYLRKARRRKLVESRQDHQKFPSA